MSGSGLKRTTARQSSVYSSGVATSRSRNASLISCASATCSSVVSSSGAKVKSMNLAGVLVIMETRHLWLGFYFEAGFEALRMRHCHRTLTAQIETCKGF